MIHNRHLAIILIPLTLALAACGNANAPDPARTLQIGNFAEPGTLDPNKLDGAWEGRIADGLFMGLTTNLANGDIAPGMATSWTTSPDGLTWTFKLRDAQWSDGTPVSAADFVSGMQRLMTSVPASSSVSVYFFVENAEAVRSGKMPANALGVRALDPKTVEFKLNRPAPYLPRLLTWANAAPVPRHIIASYGEAWIKPEHMVGNGPYLLKEWKAGDFVHLVKNPKFYDAASVCLNDLYFYPTKDVIAAERAVRSGKLDINFDFSGSRLAEINKNMPGYAHVTQGQRTSYINFNMRRPEFKDLRVRQALSMAVDRDFIALQVLADGSEPAYSIVPKGIKSYAGGTVTLASKGQSQDVRVAKAKALLEAAGYGPNKPLVLTFAHRNSGEVPKIAPVLQANWQSIAPWVKITLQGNDNAIHYASLQRGDYQFADASWGTITSDAIEHLEIIRTGGGSNDGAFSDPVYDKLLDRAARTADIKQREKAFLEAEARALDQLGITPVIFDSMRQLVNPRVTGYQVNGTGDNPFRLMCTKEAQAAK
ncbi:MAG: peptide ABC transporter substrate-binding protein [Hyphomonadaceae bacterium]|jgi:oligopeptide transport system substrate-binding protein|uniref:peptide ABC transporter substrate-binding protein n=1 Tax=Aquidulcibacter sp. TaxID=2052990 RepID=UPI0022C5D0EC|nr:peptide ABC transporter substrate-binding protein [Aquidulcibacter sp.]MCE2889824.1 peptide ABC transporter substrate-binding protein [Hyphomonadaceae bacterium]MCZ8208544.1 peptide ABC transporter substrate-binding protein [Aquidulcibacter sp.]